MPHKWNIFADGNSPRVARCQRCNLIYPEENKQCHHCIGMKQHEALEYGKHYKANVIKKTAPLGRIFLHIAIWLTVILYFAFRY